LAKAIDTFHYAISKCIPPQPESISLMMDLTKINLEGKLIRVSLMAEILGIHRSSARRWLLKINKYTWKKGGIRYTYKGVFALTLEKGD
jgi:hypothetical protein